MNDSHSTKLFVPLAQLAKDDDAVWGRKAAWLGEAQKNGFSVSDGFAFRASFLITMPTSELSQLLESKVIANELPSIPDDGWVARGSRLDALYAPTLFAVGTFGRSIDPFLKNLRIASWMESPGQLLSEKPYEEFANVLRYLAMLQKGLGSIVVQRYLAVGAEAFAGTLVTRNPVTGESKPFGEVLRGKNGFFVGQVEKKDLLPIFATRRSPKALDATEPTAAKELLELAAKVEDCFGTVCEIEFALVEQQLWVMEVRAANASDEAKMGWLQHAFQHDELVLRSLVETTSFPSKLVRTELMPGSSVLARGVGASAGAASGELFVDAASLLEKARTNAATNNPWPGAILVCVDATAHDREAIKSANAIVTAQGGITSHAAVMARGFGIPCIVSAQPLRIDETGIDCKSNYLPVGSVLSVDGSAGTLHEGDVPRVEVPAHRSLSGVLTQMEAWILRQGSEFVAPSEQSLEARFSSLLAQASEILKRS